MPDPGPVLVEQRLDEGDPDKVWVRRVTESGEVHVLTNVSADIESDGTWRVTHTDEPFWEHQATLAEPDLRRLLRTIDESGFFDLPAEIDPSVSVIHGADEAWTVRLGGREHQVWVRGLPDNQVPAVAAIAEAIETGLQAADAG